MGIVTCAFFVVNQSDEKRSDVKWIPAAIRVLGPARPALVLGSKRLTANGSRLTAYRVRLRDVGISARKGAPESTQSGIRTSTG
jgi:hypothetical protein